MPTIVVEKCCECPLRDTGYEYEWSEYECPYGPPPTKVSERGTQSNSTIQSDTEEPPDWCPLRRESFIIHAKPAWIKYDKDNPDG